LLAGNAVTDAADLGGMRGGSLKDAPYAPPPYSWTGAYWGVQTGYVRDNNSDVPWGDFGNPLTNNDGPLVYNGWVLGGHLGYNFQRGSFVYGVEGDIEWTSAEGDDEDRGGHTNGIDGNWMGSIRARVGFARGPSLFYLTGGYAYLHADAVVRDVPAQPKISTSFNGWTLGAGWQYAFDRRWSMRIEYRYTDFGLEVESYNVAGYRLGFEPEIHAVRIGISSRF
jgi:outer membrane immunogenic protein